MRFPLLLFASALVSWAQAEEREVNPRFKGVELYSWHDETANAWHFSLLSGTNRLKTPAEIMAPGRMAKDVAALKEQLSRLAVGEYVSWNSVDRAHPALPPQQVLDDIVRAATALQLRLSVPRVEKER